MSLLVDIQGLLVAGRVHPTLGVLPGVTATIQGGTMNNTPDRLVGLYDATGFEPERVMGRIAAEKINLQVLARDVKYSDAETLAQQCFNILDQFVGTLMPTGKQYKAILARTSPFSIGKDENNRTTFSCNYVVTKER